MHESRISNIQVIKPNTFAIPLSYEVDWYKTKTINIIIAHHAREESTVGYVQN